MGRPVYAYAAVLQFSVPKVCRCTSNENSFTALQLCPSRPNLRCLEASRDSSQGFTSSAEETLQGEPSSKPLVYAMTEFNVAMLLLADGNGVNTASEIETIGR